MKAMAITAAKRLQSRKTRASVEDRSNSQASARQEAPDLFSNLASTDPEPSGIGAAEASPPCEKARAKTKKASSKKSQKQDSAANDPSPSVSANTAVVLAPAAPSMLALPAKPPHGRRGSRSTKFVAGKVERSDPFWDASLSPEDNARLTQLEHEIRAHLAQLDSVAENALNEDLATGRRLREAEMVLGWGRYGNWRKRFITLSRTWCDNLVSLAEQEPYFERARSWALETKTKVNVSTKGMLKLLKAYRVAIGEIEPLPPKPKPVEIVERLRTSEKTVEELKQAVADADARYVDLYNSLTARMYWHYDDVEAAVLARIVAANDETRIDFDQLIADVKAAFASKSGIL
jgi:hypothetical protein